MQDCDRPMLGFRECLLENRLKQVESQKILRNEVCRSNMKGKTSGGNTYDFSMKRYFFNNYSQIFLI